MVRDGAIVYSVSHTYVVSITPIDPIDTQNEIDYSSPRCHDTGHIEPTRHGLFRLAGRRPISIPAIQYLTSPISGIIVH